MENIITDWLLPKYDSGVHGPVGGPCNEDNDVSFGGRSE